MDTRKNQTSKRKGIHYYMRVLHRDIGFLILGLIVIYSISGVVLTFRGTDYFKSEKQVEQQLDPNLQGNEVGQVLRIRRFQVDRETAENVFFSSGSYNKETGIAVYTVNELPPVLETFNDLHKSRSNSLTGWFSTVLGLLLLFMAVSSFWMFRTCTRQFKRGMIFTAAGIIISIMLMII